MMHARQFEHLLHRRAKIDQTHNHTAVAALVIGRFVERDEGSEAGAIDQSALGEVDFDGLEVRREPGTDFVSERARVGSAQFANTLNT